MVKITFISLLALLPSITFAQIDAGNSIFDFFYNAVNILIPLLITAAVLIFLWNLFLYLTKAGEEKEKAASGMGWGLLIIFVMVSITGIIALVTNSVSFNDNDIPTPDFNNSIDAQRS